MEKRYDRRKRCKDTQEARDRDEKVMCGRERGSDGGESNRGSESEREIKG